MMHKFGTGCRRDKRDDRDFLMRTYLPVVKIPRKMDYTKTMTPVRDQGDEGTCVGFASVVGMKEYQEWAETSSSTSHSSSSAVRARATHNPQPAPLQLSPRFLYFECKKLDGYPNEEGTEIRIAMKVLKNTGVCREEYWQYEPHDPDGPDAPVRKMKADAAKNKVLSYARILDLDDLRMSLAHKGPCVIGIQCFQGIMKTRTGVVPMPKSGERTLGGHAICPVGYDDAAKVIKFKNSWSADWGTGGYGWLPYKYIEKYMMDAWSSVDIIDDRPLTIDRIVAHVKKQRPHGS